MSKEKLIGFSELSLFCKVGVVGGFITLLFYAIAFFAGFIIGVLN